MLAINQDETLSSFFTKVYQTEIKVELQPDPEIPSELARLVTVSISGSPAFEFSFHRTTRVPEDGLVHVVPSCVGKYPLFNNGEYKEKLPQHMRDQGGIFMPMFGKYPFCLG